jgi:hypothetical protein
MKREVDLAVVFGPGRGRDRFGARYAAMPAPMAPGKRCHEMR